MLAFPCAAALAAGAPERVRSGDIEQAWFRLTQSLDPPDIETVRERTDEILQTARKNDIEVLTPLALALVAEARTQPPAQADALLVQATRLDPSGPEAWLSLASVRLRRGNLVAGLASLGRGTASLLAGRRLQALVLPSLLLATLVTLLGALALWSVLAIRRTLPRLWHDLTEMGHAWRMGPNATVLAIMILGLPLFAAGDPVWLLVWVFTLCWAYLAAGERFLGAIGLVVLAASPTLVELGFRNLTHPPNAVLQATVTLADQRYEPLLLEELGALGDVFGDDPDYHRLVGDCYRQFGVLDAAAVAYREGLRLAPKNGPLAVALGTVHYLEGDYNAALQSFQVARDAAFDPAVVSYNLSLTYGQTYHFRESEEAMAAARQANDPRLQEQTERREHQIILPAFRRDEAEAMLARKDPLLLLNRGLLPPPLARERTFGHPLTIAGVLALFLALGHFLIRQHIWGFATACLKCGRPFCRRCKLSEESQNYCTQCVNIFLKKDMVAIEAQLVKRRQLARRQAWLRVERRLIDVLLPGLGMSHAGRPLLGWTLAALAFTAIAAGLVWLPGFIAPALLTTSAWPLEVVCALAWLLAATLAQMLPAGGR